VRVIAGALRGKVLSTIRGDAVRPTSDKIRGAIFSALASRLGSFEGLHVLDMFAGSGALSIEALSRGAETAVLFDSAASSLGLIKKNLDACRLTQSARLVCGNALSDLSRARPEAPYDVVFIDPPYGKGMAKKALINLVEQAMLRDGAWVVVETERSESLPETLDNLQISHCKEYGGTAIHYYCFHHAHEGLEND